LSKKADGAGLGGAACGGLRSSIFSRRAFSARSRASSAATASGISVTRTPYAARRYAVINRTRCFQAPGARLASLA